MTGLVLFCGAGGSTAGMVAAGVDVRMAVDGWDKACAAHRLWHPQIPTAHSRVERAHEEVAGPFDLVWASPSCKPYSTANRTPLRGKRHPEYYSLERLLVQVRGRWKARWLIIENVGGLMWSAEGKAELAELRAAVAKRPGLRMMVSLVHSNTCGVEQIRRRVFVVVGPDYVRIPQGRDYIPPERATARAVCGDDHPNKWSAAYVSGRRATKTVEATDVARRPGLRAAWEQRHASRGVDDASNPTRHANWTGAASRGVTGRTLAECARLQQVPLHVLAGQAKTAAHVLVGNAVPPSLGEHVVRCVLRADENA